MSYTIGEVSEITGIPANTLRYYDRRGIMPYLKKNEHGDRIFEDIDLQWLWAVKCMKVSGFSIEEMREYVKLHVRGDESLEARRAMFEEKREETLAEIERLRRSLDALNYKCWYYDQAIGAGTERVHLEDGTYDMAMCYRRFKEWEKSQLGHESEVFSLFEESYPNGVREKESAEKRTAEA